MSLLFWLLCTGLLDLQQQKNRRDIFPAFRIFSKSLSAYKLKVQHSPKEKRNSSHCVKTCIINLVCAESATSRIVTSGRFLERGENPVFRPTRKLFSYDVKISWITKNIEKFKSETLQISYTSVFIIILRKHGKRLSMWGVLFLLIYLSNFPVVKIHLVEVACPKPLTFVIHKSRVGICTTKGCHAKGSPNNEGKKCHWKDVRN